MASDPFILARRPEHALPSWPRLAMDGVAIASAGALVMLAALLYLDNTTLITGNGVWKSMVIRKWKEGAPVGIDFANFLYLPGYGLALRFLPVAADDLLWRWMAMLNTVWAGIALAGVYLVAIALGLSRRAAITAAIAQAACAHFIGLTVTSEDIMPAHSFTVLAIAACISAMSAIGPRRWLWVALAAALFDLSWWFEWRLMFPLAPAIGLAYLVMPGRWPQRATRLATFIGAAFIPVVLCSLALWVLLRHTGASPIDIMGKMLWTGKGVGTGWGGWSGIKCTFLFIGVTQHLVGGGNYSSVEWLRETPHLLGSMAIAIALIALMTVFVVAIARRWDDPRWRAGGVILLGNLLAGQVFNLYSQPQDPQMHIHLMMWLPLSCGLIAEWIDARVRHMGAGPAVVIVASVLLAAFNLWGPWGYAWQRGLDSRLRLSIARLEAAAPPEQTRYVFHAFEFAMAALVASWGSKESNSGYLDNPAGRMVWAAYCWEVIDSPKHSPTIAAERLCDEMERLLSDGKRVIASPQAAQDEDGFIAAFATVTGAEKSREIYRQLHRRYQFTPAFDAGVFGQFHEVTRRPVITRQTPSTAPSGVMPADSH